MACVNASGHSAGERALLTSKVRDLAIVVGSHRHRAPSPLLILPESRATLPEQVLGRWSRYIVVVNTASACRYPCWAFPKRDEERRATRSRPWNQVVVSPFHTRMLTHGADLSP